MNFKLTWKVAALSLATLATISGCSNDDFDNVSSQGQTVITAGFEQPGAKTRTAVNSSNQVVWLEGDAFKLFYTQAGGSDGSSVFTTSDDTKQTSASFTGTALPAGATATYAVYPAANVSSLSSSTVTMTLPATFAASEASNGPMVANAGDGYTNLSFKHLCGLLKLTVTNLPVEAKKFVVAADQAIAGTATADLSQNNPALTLTTSGASSSVTVTSIDVDANGTQQTFYIPIPVGTYTNLTAKITDASGGAIAKYKDKVWSSVTVARAQMLYATFGFDIEVNASTENISSQIQAKAPTTAPTEESTTTVLVSGSIDATNPSHQNAEIKVPVVQNSNISLILDAVPSTTTDKPLKITATDATGAETPAETSTNVTTVAIPDIADKTFAPSLEVTTPNSTTELAATNETTGATFNVVTALTAKNTLVINKGVTVKEIIVKGGNILIKSGAKVEKITKSWSGSDKCIVYVETGATYPNDLSAEDFDVQYTDMAGILKNGGTLTLDKDIELTEPMVVEADVTLDLNGHKITSVAEGLTKVLNTDDALILVRRGANLTIKDPGTGGIIDASTPSSLYAAVKMTDTNDGNEGAMAKLVVESGILKGYNSAISGNGNRHNTSITINGGSLIGVNSTGIYHPQEGTLFINNGSIEGATTAVELRSGSLEINGGTLTSNSVTYSQNPNGNGTTLDGAALAISQHTTNKSIQVSIKGGTFNGIRALHEVDLQDDTTEITMSVTGGTFNGQIYSENCPAFIKGGNFNDVSAVNYAAEGGDLSITLGADVEIKDAVRLKQDAQVDLNLNGYDVVNKTTVNDDETYVFYADKGTMTIRGEGNVKSLGGESTVDGYRIAVFAAGTATFYLQGGSYYNHQSINAQLDLIYAIGNGKIYISGGTYESGCYGSYSNNVYKYWVLNKQNAAKENTVIQVTGGTFINFNPGNPNTDDDPSYVASGYKVQCDGIDVTDAHTILERKEYKVVPNN